MDGISVIIPCRNGERYLHSCIASALRQDHGGPLEVLLGDDGSTDGSARVAASFGPPVKVLRHPGGVNRGLPATRNLCIRSASQPLIALLDADDLWLPGHLKAVAGALAANPEAGLAYANGRYMTAEEEPYGDRLTYDPPLDAEALFLNCCLAPSGVVLRKSALDAVGLFDEELRHCEDYDLWLRVAERFPIAFAPVDGYLYRQHPGQMTKAADVQLAYAWRAVDKAVARYPYTQQAVRRRRAVFAYRLSQFAFRNRRFASAAYHLGRAALYDPGRAAGEIVSRVRGQATP